MFFSIIIPTYNRDHMLPKALESIYNQTFQDWECIVVDDGSTDNTRELLQQWIEKDNRFRYIYQENAERSAARNNGINNAKGEYICFLDSDDLYLADNLEKWNKFLILNNNPVALCYCDYKINNKGQISIANSPIAQKNKIEFIYTTPIVPARVAIHKSIFKTNKFDTRFNIGEDVCLWLKIVQDFDVLYSPHLGLMYNLHDDNSVNPKNPAALKMFKNYKLFFKENKKIKSSIKSKVFRAYLSKIITNIAKYYYLKNKKIKSFYYILKAIFVSPIHEHTKYRIRFALLVFFAKNTRFYE